MLELSIMKNKTKNSFIKPTNVFYEI
jgi:hypothetical protein